MRTKLSESSHEWVITNEDYWTIYFGLTCLRRLSWLSFMSRLLLFCLSFSTFLVSFSILFGLSRHNSCLNILQYIFDSIGIAIESTIDLVNDDTNRLLFPSHSLVSSQVINLSNQGFCRSIIRRIDLLPMVAAMPSYYSS